VGKTEVLAGVGFLAFAALLFSLEGVRVQIVRGEAPAALPAVKPAERTVIVVEGGKVPMLKRGALVETGPAGSEIAASVEGEALRIASVSNVIRVRDGKVLVGGVAREFEIHAVGRGRATLRVTNTGPGAAKARAVEHTVEVE
jgi:hypothetical protein